jgi:maleate isomerase
MDAMAGDTVARVRLGMITPSSNTVLEPACAAMLRAVPHVTAHFARVRVTRIGLDASAAAQFDPAPMLAAASLLADAKVQAICWNGTSASWLGLDHDEALCAAIEQQTGVPATSASLATVALLRGAKVRRFGLVSPYTPDVQRRIIDGLPRWGSNVWPRRIAASPTTTPSPRLPSIPWRAWHGR